MEEFISIIKKRDIKALMFEPNNNIFVQLFRYVFVGGISFIIDTCVMYTFIVIGINKFIAVAIGFVAGLSFNYFASKALVFKKEDIKLNNYLEFLIYGIIGVIGLGLTELLIYLCNDIVKLDILLSKIIAAAIVLIWNFAARKLILYRKK